MTEEKPERGGLRLYIYFICMLDVVWVGVWLYTVDS